MKDFNKRMDEFSELMQKGYSDLKDEIEKIRQELMPKVAPHDSIDRILAMPGSRRKLEELFGDIMEDWDGDCPIDFPGTLHFGSEDLNGEDARFYEGLSIGIPKESAVKNSDMQNKLIPIMRGYFNGDY